MGEADVEVAAADARAQAERAFAALPRGSAGGEAVAALRARHAECMALIDALAVEPEGAIKTRIHGDYHLGQVLVVQNDVMIVDFEGEPARPAEERRQKSSPLRDVAGMLRSFAYAADSAARDVAARLPEQSSRVAEAAADWLLLAETEYLRAYEDAATGSPVWVADDASRKRLLRLYLLSKALYEVNYEANNRPDWIETPVRGVLSILDQGAA
jgi:maltose alpha-D-glucosyltransferase/alpha-amylase